MCLQNTDTSVAGPVQLRALASPFDADAFSSTRSMWWCLCGQFPLLSTLPSRHSGKYGVFMQGKEMVQDH